MASRTFTVAELRALGMDGKKDSEFWMEKPSAVVDVQDANGSVTATFEYEGKFWQIEVCFPPGDWGCNDLAQYVDDADMRVDEVYKRTVTRYVRTR